MKNHNWCIRILNIASLSLIQIIKKAKTVGKDEPKKISIEREHGSNNIIIEGTISLEGVRSRSWVSVWEPTAYVMDVFKKSLEENGIKLIGGTKVQIGATPEGTILLTSRKSMPLKDILIPFMKLSNKGHGEMLTKEMGKVVHDEGSWTQGLKVIQEVVTDLGGNGDAILLRDESGMSHKNFILANDLSQMLFEAQQREWFLYLEASLPVAGEDERFVRGTLRTRMVDTAAEGNAVAKTGFLTGVATLSGYVTSKDGEKLVFSILIDHNEHGSVTGVLAAFVIELAEHSFQ